MSGKSFNSQSAPSRYRQTERGATLVEFAFVLILLLTILFGIMGFAQALYAYHFVNNAAKSASRWVAVNGSTCNDDASCNGSGGMNNGPASAANIQSYVQARVPMGIDSTKVAVSAAGVTVATSPTICATTWDAPGCTVQVTVSYPYTFLFPLLPAPTTTAPCTTPGICLSSTSEMVIAH
jgi:Flp pilus assembly protein TadG